MLPNLAQGDANKVWIVPSELNDALKGLGSLVGSARAEDPYGLAEGDFTAPDKVDVFAEIEAQKTAEEARSKKSVEQAIAEAEALEGRRAAVLRGPEATALHGSQQPAQIANAAQPPVTDQG